MSFTPWDFVFLAGFIAYFWIRGVYIQRTKKVEKALRRFDRCERLLLALVSVGALLLPVVYLATPWLAFADYTLPTAAPWCGTAVMSAALWLFWRSHADLGQNWSVTLELRVGHCLITHGVYRVIRHPMYAAIGLFGLAQGLLLSNWLAGWSALATLLVLYFVRVPREERMMHEHFPQEYRAYARRTGRLIPRLWPRADST